MSICFFGVSIVFIVLMWMRRKSLIDIFFPVIFLRKDLGSIDKPLSKKSCIIGSIAFKIIVLFIAWCILLSEHTTNVFENIFISVITVFIFEWIVVSLAKVCFVAVDKYSDTHDGLFLAISSVWVGLGTACNKNWNQSWFSLLIILFIAINLLVTLRYMMMLCIKREDFFKSEFRELTASNQVAAIALLVTVHIYSFAMLIHLLINSNVEFVLSDSNGAISNLPDIIYYVIITYTSVGYGDITPQGAVARIVATMISVTGYFMSAVVIGIIIGTAISKKSETNK